MEKRFRRDINALADVFEFVEEYAAGHAINGPVILTLRFIVEELFTNLVKYNVSDDHSDISVSLDRSEHQLILRLTDFGVEPYDITEAPEPDITLPLEKRKIGGLGIHLVKKMVDTISYDYKDRQGTITVTKHLE